MTINLKLSDRKPAALTLLIIGIDVSLIYIGSIGTLPLMWSVSGVGIITFFGTLVLANYVSSDSYHLDKGEIRKALTASLIVVYFTLLALVTCTTCGTQSLNTEFANKILENFTYVIEILVIFYFGSRTLEKIIEIRDGKKPKHKDSTPEGS